MENVIIYIIVAIIIIINIIKNYKKEKKKHEGRVIVPTAAPSSVDSPIRPFSKKTGQTFSNQPMDKSLPNDINLSESQIQKPISKYKSINDLYNIQDVVDASQEDISVLNHVEKTHKNASSNIKEISTNNAVDNLELLTSEDCKRAFIHSIIFERKY